MSNTLAGHSAWLCHHGRKGRRKGREHRKDLMTHVIWGGRLLAKSSLAPAVPAPGKGLALGRSPPPFSAIGAPGSADPAPPPGKVALHEVCEGESLGLFLPLLESFLPRSCMGNSTRI